MGADHSSRKPGGRYPVPRGGRRRAIEGVSLSSAGEISGLPANGVGKAVVRALMRLFTQRREAEVGGIPRITGLRQFSPESWDMSAKRRRVLQHSGTEYRVERDGASFEEISAGARGNACLTKRSADSGRFDALITERGQNLSAANASGLAWRESFSESSHYHTGRGDVGPRYDQ